MKQPPPSKKQNKTKQKQKLVIWNSLKKIPQYYFFTIFYGSLKNNIKIFLCKICKHLLIKTFESVQIVEIFAYVVHIRIWVLLMLALLWTTDRNDHSSKPMAYHNSEQVYEPKLEAVVIYMHYVVSKCNEIYMFLPAFNYQYHYDTISKCNFCKGKKNMARESFG